MLWAALTALSGEVEVPGAFVSFLFLVLQFGSILSAHCKHNVQLPPVHAQSAGLRHTEHDSESDTDTEHDSDTEPEQTREPEA